MAEAARFDLYSYWRTSATYRVRVALNLKGLKANEINVDIDAGEQRSAAFLKINPMGGLPTLIDRAPSASSRPLTQSLAILEYLEDIAPSPALLPADPSGRARVRSICLILAADTHPLITPRIKKYLFANGFDDVTWRAWQTNWFTTGLQAIEQEISSNIPSERFAHGNQVTRADICLASIVVVARVFKITVEAIPTIDRIMGELETIDAFSMADPHRQHGAPLG